MLTQVFRDGQAENKSQEFTNTGHSVAIRLDLAAIGRVKLGSLNDAHVTRSRRPAIDGTKAFGLLLVALLFAACDGSRDRDKAAGGKDDARGDFEG